MKPPTKIFATLLAASLFALSAPVGQAATTLVWDGGAGDNLLASANNWNPNQAPATNDVLRWDGTQAGNLSLLLNTSLATGTPGMTIDITSGQTGSIAINRASGTLANDLRLNSGASTFAMASGAGAFSVGTSGIETRIVVGPSTASTTHLATFTNNSVNAVTFGSNVRWMAGGGGPSTINFTFAGSGNFSMQGNLSGDAAPSARQITHNGTGVVTVSGNNTNITTVNIAAGAKIAVGNGGATGTLSSNTAITNNGTLAFSRNNTITQGTDFGSVIAGSGNVVQNGTGSLILSGTNTYTGTTTVSAGTLALGNVNAVQNSTLDTGTSGSQAVTFTVAGAQTYNLGGLAGADALDIGNNTISVGSNNATTSYTGNLSGTGGALTKAGTGVLTLNGTNTYTGVTSISSGTLQIGAGGTTGSIAGTSGVTNNGTLAYNRSDSLTVGYAISGTGGVNQIGAGTTTLTGNNTFTGNTTISAGTLELAGTTGNQTLGATSHITVNTGGTLLLSQSNQIKDSATITLAGGKFSTGGNETVGTLTLLSSSIIDFGIGDSILHFAASEGMSWTGTLSIYNWTPATDHIFFGNANTALTPNQLNAVSFFSGNNTGFLGTAGFGNLGELTVVPEPGTIATGFILLGLVAWRERKRLASLIRRNRHSEKIIV